MIDNNLNDISNSIDEFDSLSDDKLWDILDNFSNDNLKSDKVIEKSSKYFQFCSQCKSQNLIFASSRGSYVCGECGMESEEIFDESPEWNNYEDSKSNSDRCGATINPFFPKSSLGTTISISGYSKIKMLRNWGQVPYRERSLAEVLNDIDSKCKKYNITKAVIDGAKILYKNIREIKYDFGDNKGKNVIIRGINRKQIIAACFYFGSILQKLPRSINEVADIFCLDVKQITKGCRKFLEIMKDNFIIFDIKPSHGSDFIDRFGSKIKLAKETLQLAKTISNNATKLDIASDHQSTSIAAASILLAVNILENNISKKSISEAFAISDVTIIKPYKKIYVYQQVVVNDELTNKFLHKMNLKLMTDGLNNECIDIESDSDTQQLIDKLDESDIIKKDNVESKKNKLIKLQLEKDKRKLEKQQIKEEKEKQKLLEKEQKKANKIKKKLEKVNNKIEFNLDISDKKKRGRPKKNINIISC
jgi:transcription initiation factor TFIIIB Brf1 subunit/transcription initiation factor TFIIB